MLRAQRVDRVHLLVQLDAPPEPRDLERLAAQGVQLLSPLNKQTWYASVTGSSTTSFTGLRWAELVRAEDKISRLMPPTPFKYQLRPGGRVPYLVLFHKGVTADDVAALATRLDASSATALPEKRIQTFRLTPSDTKDSFTVTLDGASLSPSHSRSRSTLSVPPACLS